MTYDSFKLKFYNELLYFYPDAELQDDIIKIVLGRYIMEVPLTEEFEQCKVSNSYSEFFDLFKQSLAECVKQYKFNVDYDRIFPTIREDKFAIGTKYPFYKETFQAGLQIFFVQDNADLFHYISTDSIQDKIYFKEKAYKNLSKITNTLTRLTPQASIFTYKFLNDLNSSLILSQVEMERIRDLLGNKFIIALPSTTTVFFAKNKPQNFDILNKIIMDDPNPNKITDKIYFWDNGILEYANKRTLFTVI